MKKSVIKKSISRRIHTAPYEALEVNVEVEETVEWEDVKDRMKKTEAISKVLLIDFVKTLNQVAEELNINKKIAQVSKNGDQKVKESPNKKPIDTNTSDDFDFLN